MTSLLNDDRDTGDKAHIYLTTLSEEDLEDKPTLVLPTADVAQVSTQQGLIATYKSPPSSYFGIMDGLSTEDQVTWIIPVIRVSKGASKLEAGSMGAESYNSYLQKLVKRSGIYAMASFAAPLVSLILAPFLTRNLSHADYGALAVLNTGTALLAGLTQLGLGSAFFRSYNFEYESQRDRLGVLSTVVILLLLTSIPTAVTITITASWLSVVLFNNPLVSDFVRLASLVVLLQNLTVPGFAWMRAENRAAFFATLSIANLFVTSITAIVLVGVLHMGLAGSLIATSCGYALVVVCTLPIILLRAGIRIRFDIAQGLLAFGIPNVSSLVSVWVLQLSDRFLLGHLGSLVQTANYSLAYNLGSVLTVVVISPFQLAWSSVLFTIAKRDDAARIFQLVFRWYSIVLLFATYALSLVGIFALKTLFPPAYHTASPIIPIIALSTMFFGIYNFLTLGIGISNKMWFAFILTTLAALVNVGLNIILIPLYGSMGAAVSTLLAYMLLAGLAYMVNQRIYPIPFKMRIFIIALVVGIALYIISSFLAPTQGPYKACSIYLGTLVLYGGCLAFLGKVLTRSRRDKYR